jgi:hypothetical protein
MFGAAKAHTFGAKNAGAYGILWGISISSHAQYA